MATFREGEHIRFIISGVEEAGTFASDVGNYYCHVRRPNGRIGSICLLKNIWSDKAYYVMEFINSLKKSS